MKDKNCANWNFLSILKILQTKNWKNLLTFLFLKQKNLSSANSLLFTSYGRADKNRFNLITFKSYETKIWKFAEIITGCEAKTG